MRLRSLSIFALCLAFTACQRSTNLPSREEAARSREEAQTAVAEIAPAPAPESVLPLRGDDLRDAYGYPKRYVDKAALRRLLRDGRYAELTGHIEEMQKRFELDPRFEYWPIDAGDAFASSETSLGPQLDRWAAATPTSFAPYQARAAYRVSTGYAVRGTGTVDETRDENFDAMRASIEKGMSDADKALELAPKSIAAMRIQLSALRALGRREERARVLKNALAVCAECFQIRVIAMFAEQPRWGGSHAAMRKIADAAPVGANPKLRLLPGYIDLDVADARLDTTDLEGAREAIDRAIALGEHWEFLAKRGEIFRRMNELARAQSDLDRAIELRPNRPDTLFARTRLEFARKEYEAAGKDLLSALRIDPADAEGRRLFPSVVKGLIYQGSQERQAGHREVAQRLYELASELDPTNQDAEQRRREAIDPASAGDFRAQEELEYALANQGKIAEIVALWNDYLVHHPNEARAYLNRARAYYHLGKKTEALSDAKKACDLGVSEGCSRWKQLGGL